VCFYRVDSSNKYFCLLFDKNIFFSVRWRGGALLRGLDKRISRKTDLPVYVAEDPLRAVVRGTGIALKNIQKYKAVLKK